MSADTEPRSASFGSQLRRGTMWSTLDVVVARFGQFALGVVVARLLAPADFGVFAVALVVHVIVIGVSELGVTAALIRDENADVRRSGPTVQTIALVTSCVLGALMALSAPVLANLLGSPRASGAIAIMAINLPLAGLAAVPAALLRRDFRMDRIFVADTSNAVATGIVVILLATHGWGPMALAWSWVAGQLLTTILMNTYKPGRFRPGWNRGEAGRLLRFGLPLAGANIISFSILNVDFVIVGRLLGATALGLYVLAFNISGWPMTVFGSVVRSVSLPSFARLRRDGASMPDRLAAALRLLASITLPVCFLLGALATPLIKTVYGEKWALAAAALVGLSILGAARVLIELISDFLISLGRTRAVFVAQLPWLAGLIVGLLVGVHTHGIAGAGAAQAIVSVGLMIPIYLLFLSRAGVSPRKIMGSLLPPTIWAAVAAGVAFVVAGRASNPVIATLIGGSAGVLVYLAANGKALLGAYLAFKASRAADADAQTGGDDEAPTTAATGVHPVEPLDQPVGVGVFGETT